MSKQACRCSSVGRCVCGGGPDVSPPTPPANGYQDEWFEGGVQPLLSVLDAGIRAVIYVARGVCHTVNNRCGIRWPFSPR